MRFAKQLCCVLLLGVCIGFCAEMTGCAARPIHPGAANQFDSQSYDVVLLYDTAIKTAKADVAAGTFPDSGKPILNDFIDAYNVLDGAYKVYHAAALGGTSTAAQLQAVTDAQAKAAASFANLVKVFPKAAKK